MVVKIDLDLLQEYNLGQAQFFTLLAALHGGLSGDDLKFLEGKNFISTEYKEGKSYGYFIMDNARDMVLDIIRRSELGKVSDNLKDRCNSLAMEMQKLFPEGKKAGTNYYWRCNVGEVKDKLLSFLKRYGNYPDEIILSATEKYVESYNADNRYMRLLKYFIWKQDEAEGRQSDLLTWIENLNSNDDELKTTKLVVSSIVTKRHGKKVDNRTV